MSLGGRRARILVIVCALVILGVLGDTLARGQGGAGVRLAPVQAGPSTLAPVSAISSSWYCATAAGATGPTGPQAPPPTTTTTTTKATKATKATRATHATRATKATPATKAKATGSPSGATPPGSIPGGQPSGAVIALANAGPAPVGGTVSVIGEKGAAARVAVSVPAHGGTLVDEGHLVGGPDLAATVVLDGGGVAVAQRVAYGKALTVLPCASSTASSWYFASGSTLGSDRLLVSLYNPLPTNAIADLSFATDKGPAAPSDYQGVVVPGMSQVVLSVGQHVQQRSLVATTVEVRLGRLVADEVQVVPGSATSGVAEALGAPAPGAVWDLPAGLVASGTLEKLDVYNPSARAAKVRVALDLSFGYAAPIDLSVAPGSVTELVANTRRRIPHNSLFGIVATSTNGVGVVVERSFIDRPPQPGRGLADTVGGVAARTWTFASGAPAASAHELVVVEDPGPLPARVSVTGLDGGSGPAKALGSAQVVDPGRSLTLALPGVSLGTAVVVSADRPVVVEQSVVGPAGHGVSSVLGEPAA